MVQDESSILHGTAASHRVDGVCETRGFSPWDDDAGVLT